MLAVEAMGNLGELFGTERSDLRNIFLSNDDPDRVKELVAGFNGHAESAAKYFAAYEKTIDPNENESAYFMAKDTYLGPFANMKKEVFALMEKGDFDVAYKTFMDAGPSCIGPITTGLATSAEQNNKWAADANDAGSSTYTALTIIMAVALVIAVAASMFLVLYISGLISKPLLTLVAFMQKAGSTGNIELTKEDSEIIQKYSLIKDEIGQCINSTANFISHITTIAEELEIVAGGDLTVQHILLSESDTIGLSLQKTINNLNHMFTEINSSSNQVTTGSVQIADGAQLLAQGATEQSATVEQLSASVADVSAQTKQNASMASDAKELGENIKKSAEQGSGQMEQMMVAVQEINESSKSIGKVIKIIDDIAFQTNILALNAAVEAARAGQHGKGFAVVADEVRSLAAKSAEAAKNTNELIESSIMKAELGANISVETSESLRQIVAGILRSGDLIASISTSSNEQSVAISQISEAIDQVSQVVQQNSATAEESAAASEEMSGQATLLQQLISQFKLQSDFVSAGHAHASATPSSAQAHASGATIGFSVIGGGK